MRRPTKALWIIAGVIIALFGFAFADAGDTTDPLITLSYLEMRLSSLDTASDGSGAATFAVFKVEAGQELILGASSEAILRSGKAVAVASARGGLADVTTGIDLTEGTIVPTNHLIICPLADGRGFRFQTESWIMVKGGYSLQ